MSQGQGSISYQGPSPGAGGGLVFLGARNGLSLDAGGFVVLGQTVGEAGSPAALLSNREIPTAGFFVALSGSGKLLIGTTAMDATPSILQVDGDASIKSIYLPLTDATNDGILFANALPFLHNFEGEIVPGETLSVFLGTQAGNFTMTGNINTAVGYQAMQQLTSAQNNSGFGVQALQNLLDGFNNTADGPYTLQDLQHGFDNTAVGTKVLSAMTSGNGNTAIGAGAGENIDTGNSNIFIGDEAGNFFTGAVSNKFVLTSTSNPPVAASYGFLCGDMGNNDETGKLGINFPNYTVVPLFTLDVRGTGGYTAAGLSAAAVPSALLYLNSTSSGFLRPRMTTVQKNAIAAPAEGLMVYDLTLHLPQVYNGTSWITG